MNAETQTASTELALVSANPVAVITDAKRFDDFLSKMRDTVRSHVPDTSTAKGREAIKSLAFKVVKSKTALEAAAKALKEEAQETVNKVNGSIRKIREDLDELAAETRAPLTAWEEAEKARIARCEELMRELRSAAVVEVGESAEAVHARLDGVQRTLIDAGRFGELEPMATALKATAVQSLIAAVERLRRDEAERAELERLRAEAAERAERERAMQEEAERAERVAEEARRLEAEAAGTLRLAAEEAERVRIEREELIAAAAETARAEAAEAAQKAREAAEREAQEARDAEAARVAQGQRQRDAAHAQALAEAQRERDDALATQERERHERDRQERAIAAQAEEQRRQDEARTADRNHRSEVMGAAKAALMESCKLSEATAKKIVLTICAGDVPHCSIKF